MTFWETGERQNIDPPRQNDNIGGNKLKPQILIRLNDKARV